MKKIIFLKKKQLIDQLWKTNPHIHETLIRSKTLHEARDALFEYLNGLERHYFNIYSDAHYKDIPIVERNNAKQCIRILKNVIRTENEHITGTSALKHIHDIARRPESVQAVSEGFIAEFTALFMGISGKSGIFADSSEYTGIHGRRAAQRRSKKLDEYADKIVVSFRKYRTGMDPDVIAKRRTLKKKILDKFNGTEDDWHDYRWHLRHVIKDLTTLSKLVHLEKDEVEGLQTAEKNGIPFQITPYYLSLFNESGRTAHDRAIRAQVIPSSHYASAVASNKRMQVDMDFMDEKSTSPIDCITRRYPQILILKPFDSCPQICVYCQRNWEVKGIEEGGVTPAKVKKAIAWVRRNPHISEVLLTGGDPLTLGNAYLASIISEIAAIPHVERIRIGTRTFATVPFRFDDRLISTLKKYHEPGKREICLVTHFEHPTEVTPDVVDAVRKVKRLGIGVYNQQVFTYYNSRRFETALLRKTLKLCGIDPYYTFNTKGKDETLDFRVPIARLEQERKEEARLLPGIVRTDEMVFNLPRLGKSHLRAWQDHEPIMILPDGRRAYRFYPWESQLALMEPYVYTDVSIYDYLKRLEADGEDPEDYKSIWYYF
ncbi:MAG: KamA family radical SAM protein [Candidatus Micrarchaeia archaeon]|jgi:lysine 2,3-aminomutase